MLLSKGICWDLSSLATLKLNFMQPAKKSKVSGFGRKVLKGFLRPNYLIYDHFNRKLDKAAARFGEREMKVAIRGLDRYSWATNGWPNGY